MEEFDELNHFVMVLIFDLNKIKNLQKQIEPEKKVEKNWKSKNKKIFINRHE